MNIYLIGFMGSGKSTTGRKLAEMMGWMFCDTDCFIEEEEKLSISDIFSTYGEDYFREKEKVVLENLASKSGIVVACGGGMPCKNENITLMRKTGVVVYLEMTPAALMKRLDYSNSERPLLKNLSGEELYSKINSLLDERRKFFDQAHFNFSGLNVNLNRLSEEIIHFLNKGNGFSLRGGHN